MVQLITCPDCNKQLQVPDDLIGTTVQCPECKHTFTARTEEDTPRSTHTTATPPEPTKKTYGVAQRDDDEYVEDRPLRRNSRPSRRGRYAPHRGGMILAFGIISIVAHSVVPGAPVVFGIIAWIMGNNDLAEIQSGRMDPEGEGMTQAGRILGMIGTLLFVAGAVGVCGLFGCAFLFPALAVFGG